MKLCIITPTYNRVSLLERLVESLKQQQDNCFTWLVIDDGSTDSTASYINSIRGNLSFNIEFDSITNGGKSNALRFAFSKYHDDYDFFLIVDSDDYLIDNAISTIKSKVLENINNFGIGAVFFRYDFIVNSNQIDSIDFKYEEIPYISSRISHDNVYGKYDGSIGYYARAIKEYNFPKFSDEKYLGPTVLQILIDSKYKIAFYNDVIGIAEYQAGGLSKTGRILRLNNPLGMILYSGLYQKKSLKNNLKYSISAQAYRINSKFTRRDLKKYSLDRYIKLWAYIPGAILSIIWRKNNRDDK